MLRKAQLLLDVCSMDMKTFHLFLLAFAFSSVDTPGAGYMQGALTVHRTGCDQPVHSERAHSMQSSSYNPIHNPATLVYLDNLTSTRSFVPFQSTVQ
jgi:hypothetical protein